MGDKLTLSFDSDEQGRFLRIDVRDAKLIGQHATLKLMREAHVKRSNPIHHQRVLLERKLVLSAGAQSVPLDGIDAGDWIYSGRHLDLRIRAELEVDDGVLFDTREECFASAPKFPGPLAPDDSRKHAEPADRFSLIANLRAIPGRNRMIAIGLLIVGLPLILANAVLGWHDQMAPPGQTVFYDHVDSEGESQSPLMNSLFGSGGVGMALWFALRAQLRRYMTIEVSPSVPRTVGADTRLDARSLVRGSARVPLTHCSARVVASNRERGQYKHKTKNKTETRSFTELVRSVVLWEQQLPHVPAGSPLQDWLGGELDFSRLFQRLHPPVEVGDNHGVDIVWEFQLLHPDFVDQELHLPQLNVDYGDRL